MRKDLLTLYINKLTKDDVRNYITRECIEASEEEIDLIYSTIKNEHEYILNNDFMSFIAKYEYKLNKQLYLKIIEQYNKYKNLVQ